MVKKHTDCEADLLSIKDALDVISGKWKLMIMLSIGKGNHRFREIERSIPKLSGKVLAKELKDLEQHDLIKRTIYDEYPVRIEYTITTHAESLEPLYKALINWGKLHRERIINIYQGE